MRHRVQDKKFNRDVNQRKALLTGLLRNMAEHGQIITTVAKAKELKRLMDKMVTQAKGNSIQARRELHRTFGKRDVVNTFVDVIAPAMADRTSGFTTISKLGPRRGDNTPMAKISFVNGFVTGSLKKPKSAEATKTKHSTKKTLTEKISVKAESVAELPAPTKKTAKKAAPKKTAKTEVKE
jgi:large subunit ribosomal protein L17